MRLSSIDAMRRFMLLAALAGLALLASADPAAPAGRIVVFGALSGSHLTLTTSGSNVVVEGYMAASGPAGCRIARSQLRAVCPLAEATEMEIVMGPSGDLVEVLERLPFPLTVHLGSGEDKFIGNGERDTCFPEGTRRNRCVGGGGNDVCITGQQNSDCVGGPGNDYCRTGAGSDGCWGGPGRDFCSMGPGQDGCHGGPGNDRLYGGRDPDQLYGGPGFDYCDGGPGVGKSHQCEAGPRH
jgi:Ca2+-binding RTX toxin-like protein